MVEDNTVLVAAAWVVVISAVLGLLFPGFMNQLCLLGCVGFYSGMSRKPHAIPQPQQMLYVAGFICLASYLVDFLFLEPAHRAQREATNKAMKEARVAKKKEARRKREAAAAAGKQD